MDKQKQIEEMEKDIAVRMAMAKGIAGSMNNGVEGWLSEYLIGKGWAKIPENAVVLTDEEYERWQGQTISFGKIRKEAIVNFMKDLTYFIGHMKPSEYSIVEAILEIEHKAYEIAEKFNVKLNDVIKEEN